MDNVSIPLQTGLGRRNECDLFPEGEIRFFALTRPRRRPQADPAVAAEQPEEAEFRARWWSVEDQDGD